MTDQRYQVISIVPPDSYPSIDYDTRELMRVTSIKDVGRETHVGMEVWEEGGRFYREVELILPDPATLPEVQWEYCPDCAANWIDEDDL